MKIKIKVRNIEMIVDLDDSKLAKQVYEMLPLESEAKIWKGEVYFDVLFMEEIENEQKQVDIGDFCYWPRGPSLCIFYSETPGSFGNKPTAHSDVQVIGKVVDIKSHILELVKVEESDKVIVEKLE